MPIRHPVARPGWRFGPRGRRLGRWKESVQRPVFRNQDGGVGEHTVEVVTVEVDGDGAGGVGGDVIPASVVGAAIELDVVFGEGGECVVVQREGGGVTIDDW